MGVKHHYYLNIQYKLSERLKYHAFQIPGVGWGRGNESKINADHTAKLATT